MTVEIKGVATKAVVYNKDTKDTTTLCYVRDSALGTREIKGRLNGNGVLIDLDTYKFKTTLDLFALTENGASTEDAIIDYVRTCFEETIDYFV